MAMTVAGCLSLVWLLFVFTPPIVSLSGSLLAIVMGTWTIVLIYAKRLLEDSYDDMLFAYTELIYQHLTTAAYGMHVQSLLVTALEEMREEGIPVAENIGRSLHEAARLHLKYSPMVDEETRNLIERLLRDEGGIVI